MLSSVQGQGGGRGGGLVDLGAEAGSICSSMLAAHCKFSRLKEVQNAFAAQCMCGQGLLALHT